MFVRLQTLLYPEILLINGILGAFKQFFIIIVITATIWKVSQI